MGGIGLWNDIGDPNDLIYDDAHGTLTTVTNAASVTVIVPPSNCKSMRLDTNQAIYINTQNKPAAADGTSIPSRWGRRRPAPGLHSNARAASISTPRRVHTALSTHDQMSAPPSCFSSQNPQSI